MLGKFTIEDEELVVAETIESGSDSDVFEQTLDAGEDDFDPFEALMAAAGKEEDEDEKKSQIVSDETLFSEYRLSVSSPHISKSGRKSSC